MSAAQRRRWTVEGVVALAARLHPYPVRVSWSWTTRKLMGGALRGAVTQGLLRPVRGAPGADWYALPVPPSSPEVPDAR